MDHYVEHELTLKREDMYKYTDPTKISLMKSIKDIFDPNSILNPGSIFLDSELRN